MLAPTPASAAPQFTLTTPEHVTFRVQPAGLATRASALMIDALIVLVLKVAALITLAAAMETGIAVALIVWFAIDFGYYTYFEWKWSGQTPGKRRLRIRTISTSGVRLAPSEAVLRNLLRTIDTLPLTMVVGGIVAFLDRHNRRLGDFVAGTLVVASSHAALPAPIARRLHDQNSFWDDAGLRTRILARATREERDVLFDLLVCRDELAPLERQSVFAQASEYFRGRYRIQSGAAHLTDEQTVLNIALVLSKADERSEDALATAPV